MTAVGVTPSGAVIAENIRDLQHWPGHGGGVLGWWVGPLGTRWLGFTGSGLVWIALGEVALGRQGHAALERADVDPGNTQP